jgi:hypothetical protein
MRIPILYKLEILVRDARKRWIQKYLRNVDPYGPIRKEQDRIFQERFRHSRHLIVFVNFEKSGFCGGIMTLFHFADISRAMKAIHGCDVLHANIFSRHGVCYLKQPGFENEEDIFRLEQVMRHAPRLETLILHIPEILVAEFAEKLTYRWRSALKGIRNLRINILNQNIECFPEPEAWASLRTLTDKLSQTTGFDRYTTQEVCDHYGVPLYRLIGYNGLHRKYGKTALETKERLLIYSLDPHPMKERILDRLRTGLPDFRFQQIQGLTFDEFMKTAQRAMFSVTFGEGFDGYFTNIHFVGGIGFAVYNRTFFPSEQYLEHRNVYRDYEHMEARIVEDIRHYLENASSYATSSSEIEHLNQEFAYNERLTFELMERYYKQSPTFVPRPLSRAQSE